MALQSQCSWLVSTDREPKVWQTLELCHSVAPRVLTTSTLVVSERSEVLTEPKQTATFKHLAEGAADALLREPSIVSFADPIWSTKRPSTQAPKEAQVVVLVAIFNPISYLHHLCIICSPTLFDFLHPGRYCLQHKVASCELH